MMYEELLDVKTKGIVVDTATIIDLWKCIKNSKEDGNNNDKIK